MTPAEIDIAFRSTDYIILKNDVFANDITLKIGIDNDFKYSIIIHEWAFITAWNPLPVVLSKEENIERNNALLNELKLLGYTCHLGKGVSSDGTWEEESFFIENIDKHTALFIAQKYGQLAFIHGVNHTEAELIYATAFSA